MDLVNGSPTEGTNIAAWTFVDGNTNQIFGIDTQHSFEPLDLGTGFYASVIHSSSGSAVTVDQSNNIVIHGFSGSDEQMWLFEQADDRMYKIRVCNLTLTVQRKAKRCLGFQDSFSVSC